MNIHKQIPILELYIFYLKKLYLSHSVIYFLNMLILEAGLLLRLDLLKFYLFHQK